MTWRRRIMIVALATAGFLLLVAALEVVRQHGQGDCWPWQEQTVLGDGTFCDGRPYNPTE